VNAAKSPRHTTIRDVAAEAQVSISTVSLFVQGGSGVAPDTAQRIAAAMQKLGYAPRGRRVSPNPPHLFGLFMEELSGPAFPQAVYGGMVRGLEVAAKRHSYNLLFSSVEEGNVPQIILDNQMGGAVLLGGSPATNYLAVELFRRRFPLVLLDNYITGLAVDAVVPDNEWGGYQALEHLVDLGHRRIAIINGPSKYRVLSDRLWGALRAADIFGIAMPPTYLRPSISSGFPNKGYREMKELLKLPDQPTAVFAVSDRAAFGALEAIKEAGLSVPDDISLVGFDDEVWAEHANPPITTMRYARIEMGALAMELLLERIHGKSTLPVRTNVYTELVVRQSTAPPRHA